MTMWRARLLGALALAGTSALLAAAPARAQTVFNPTPSASFAPADHGSTLSYSVTWTPPNDGASYINSASLSVSGTQPDGKPISVPSGQCPGSPWGVPPGATPQTGPSRTCSAATFTAVYNGTYDAASTAVGCDWFDPCSGNTAKSNTVSWPTVTINNAPAKPTGLAGSYDNANRLVKLTWNSNTEPDLIDYLVLRQNSPTDTPSIIATVTSLSYTDNSLGNGGDFAYAVVAERAGVGGSISSDASDPVAESVPPPPAPTTTTAAGPGGASGGSGGSGGTTSTTQKLLNPGLKPPSNYTPSKLDLSAFAKALSAAKARSNASAPSGGDNGSVSGESDTYKQSLPYGSASPNSGTEDGSQQADAPPLARASTNAKDNVRTAAAVAGGLLAIVLAMHGMWLRSEVKRAALLEAVEPEGSDPEEFRDFWLGSNDDPWGG